MFHALVQLLKSLNLGSNRFYKEFLIYENTLIIFPSKAKSSYKSKELLEMFKHIDTKQFYCKHMDDQTIRINFR